METDCPFCGSRSDSPSCISCGREKTAPRRVCECGNFSPTSEVVCCHCGKQAGNELFWKVPLIVGLFVLAFVFSVIVAVLSN